MDNEAMWFWFAVGSVIAWSLALVMDSVLVKCYEKNPFVLMWTQSCVSMVFLAIAAVFVPFESAWIPWLILTSVVAYCGDILLFIALDRMDASVVNLSWAFITLYSAIIGFVFFGESWNAMQTVAALCIVSGVVLLSYWHHHVSVSALVILLLIAAMYVPSNVVVKLALDLREYIFTLLFWQLAAREATSFVFPWSLSSFRKRIITLPKRVNALFYILTFFVIVAYFIGMYCLAMALASGPISLVSVVGNTQPFVVLFFGWLFWKLFPKYCSKELLDGQSVSIKLISFCIVFAGLSLLAVG